MSQAWNDGALPISTPTLTIGGITYFAEQFDIRQPSGMYVRRNADNEPAGSFGWKEAATGTATLQLATSSTAIPAVGATFVNNTITYIITEVGAPQVLGQEHKITISFIRSYAS